MEKNKAIQFYQKVPFCPLYRQSHSNSVNKNVRSRLTDLWCFSTMMHHLAADGCVTFRTAPCVNHYLIVMELSVCPRDARHYVVWGFLSPGRVSHANWSWVRNQTRSDPKAPMSRRLREPFTLPRIGLLGPRPGAMPGRVHDGLVGRP